MQDTPTSATPGVITTRLLLEGVDAAASAAAAAAAATGGSSAGALALRGAVELSISFQQLLSLEGLETLLRQSEEVLLMSAPLHAWPSTFSRLGVRQQLLAPDDGTMHHLKRLVRKVVHENRDLRSELRSEADYEIAVPLPRRAQTVK
jgi:hypothetical protein